MSDKLVLTKTELHELTGYSQLKRQAQWLTERGWPFETSSKAGHPPKVDRAYYVARMSGTLPEVKPTRPAMRLDLM